MPYFPVIVDASIDAQGDGLLDRYGQPFVYNNNLYIALVENINRTGGGPAVVNVYKSVDQGATWTALDALNGPRPSNALYLSGSRWDGANTIVCVYSVSAGLPAALQFQDFDLVSQTWGPVYGVSAAVWSINFLGVEPILRPDGTRFVLGLFNVGGFPGGGLSGAQAASFDPGTNTWTAIFDPAANVILQPGWDGTKMKISRALAALQADGTTHWFFSTVSILNAPHVWTNRVFYQQIAPNNSLGSFFDFPGQDAVSQDLLVPASGGASFGVPLIVGSNIVLPVTRAIPWNPATPYPTLYVGTPLAAPVWTELTTMAGIDAACQGGGTPPTADLSLCPQSFLAGYANGNQITFVWIVSSDFNVPPFLAVDLARIRSATTTDLNNPTLGWVDSTLFDMTVDPVPAGFYPLGGAVAQALVIPGMSLFGSQIILAVDAWDPASADLNNPIEARFWMGAFVPEPPVVPPSLRITLRGIKRRLCGPSQPAEEYTGRPPDSHVIIAR